MANFEQNCLHDKAIPILRAHCRIFPCRPLQVKQLLYSMDPINNPTQHSKPTWTSSSHPLSPIPPCVTDPTSTSKPRWGKRILPLSHWHHSLVYHDFICARLKTSHNLVWPVYVVFLQHLKTKSLISTATSSTLNLVPLMLSSRPNKPTCPNDSNSLLSSPPWFEEGSN